MEATHNRSSPGGLRRLAGTRRGAAIIAAAAAALAGIVLLAFISQYKDRVQGGTVERAALVANRLIPKGTSGAVVVGDGLFKPATVQEDNLESGALSSAAALDGKVATHDIYPGQQITAADFASDADPLRGQLRGDQRAIAVPLDSAHGMIGEVRAGDAVDVLAGFNSANSNSGRGRPQLRTLIQDVRVLKAPDAGTKPTSGNDTNDLTVRVTTDQAAQLAFAADNGKVWFVLRPPVGGKSERPSSVTLDSLLAGTPTIEVGR
jgi:Flp pilus assembly protein CpaB